MLPNVEVVAGHALIDSLFIYSKGQLEVLSVNHSTRRSRGEVGDFILFADMSL